MRIIVTSDIHYDDEADLTPPARVEQLVDEVRTKKPDLVILAGDLGHPLRNYKSCIEAFSRVGAPVAVVAGNHDVWRDPESGVTSADLFERLLPGIVREAGMIWLEHDSILIGRTAIVGSLCWYDYSAVDRTLGLSDDQVKDLKAHATNDSVWIDWPWTDKELAARLKSGVLERLAAFEWDAAVDTVFLATHVPVFETQIERRVADSRWSLLRAFFGNPTTGASLHPFGKLRFVVSGHTHRGVAGVTVPRDGSFPINAYVVGSDYGEPATVLIEVEDRTHGPVAPKLLRGAPPWLD